MTDSDRPSKTRADESPEAAEALPVTEAAAATAVKTLANEGRDPLRVLPWIALVAVAALVLGRFVAPSLPGAVVGMARTVRFFEVAGSALTQLFAALSLVGLAIALLGLANSTVSAFLRLLAIATSGWVALMVVFGAITADRVAEMPALVGGLFAGTLAVLAAVESRGAPVARLPALVLGLVGASSILRALFGFASLEVVKISPAALQGIGGVVATAALSLTSLAALLALVHIGRSSRAEAASAQAPSQASLWSPASIVVLVVALVCARQAMVGASSDAGLGSVLLKRAADRFLTQPLPLFGAPARLFLGFLTPLTAIALLSVRRMRTLAAALSLAMVAADVAGAPLGAIALVLASLAVLLVARSGHVLWSALIARPPSGSRSPR